MKYYREDADRLVSCMLMGLLAVIIFLLCLTQSCVPRIPATPPTTATPSPMHSPLKYQEVVSPLSTPSPAPTTAPNLLSNPSLEPDYFPQQGIPEIYAAHDWSITWLDKPPCIPLQPGCDLPCPDNCTREAISEAAGTHIRITATTSQVMAIKIQLITTTRPIGAIESHLHFNPSYLQIITNTAPTGKTVKRIAYISHEIEPTTPTTHTRHLFTAILRPLPNAPLTTTIELNYFLGDENGGWYGGTGWYPGITASEKITIEVRTRPRCATDYGCYWARPEMRETHLSYRVSDGSTAQQMFGFRRMFQASIFQPVQATQGQWYRFCADVQGWQCFDHSKCNGGKKSDAPYAFNFQISLDDAISTPSESFDHFSQICVIDQAHQDTITPTVSVRSMMDFARNGGNDAYIDKASLQPIEVYQALIPFVAR